MRVRTTVSCIATAAVLAAALGAAQARVPLLPSTAQSGAEHRQAQQADPQPQSREIGFRVLAPGIRQFGKTYNELAGDWWNWAVRFPLQTNPIVESGAVDCTRGQTGKIWFLAGNFGGGAGEPNPLNRECTIPEGKALFFPLINTLWWFPEDGPNVDALRAIANQNINPTTFLEVIIDGVTVKDPFAYRAQSQPGGFAADFGPLYADFGYGPLPDPRKPAVSDGYWILLAPLPQGAHVIQIRSARPGFALDVTYRLTVSEHDD